MGERCVLNPAVIYDEKNEEFVMLYHAAGNDVRHQIKLDRIEELDADVLPNEDRNGFMYHMYCHIASPSEI